jgi:hypothetical protein
LAFLKVNVTVTGVLNTVPDGSNWRIGLSAVIPCGAVASVVVIVIVVFAGTAPGGTSSLTLLSASLTVPPAAGVTAALAVCIAGVFDPPPHPIAERAAKPAATLIK